MVFKYLSASGNALLLSPDWHIYFWPLVLWFPWGKVLYFYYAQVNSYSRSVSKSEENPFKNSEKGMSCTQPSRTGSGRSDGNSFPASLTRRPVELFGRVIDVLDPKYWKHQCLLLRLFVSWKPLPDLWCGKEAASHLFTSGPHEINGKRNFLLQLHPKTASISPPHLLMRTEWREHVSFTVPCDNLARCLLIHLMILLVETSHTQK